MYRVEKTEFNFVIKFVFYFFFIPLKDVFQIFDTKEISITIFLLFEQNTITEVLRKICFEHVAYSKNYIRMIEMYIFFSKLHFESMYLV